MELSLKEQQKRLQNEYDLICNLMVECYIENKMMGYNEYLWRKYEIENLSEILHIDLLKKRDTNELLDRAVNKYHLKEVNK